jgi:uncharacterized membrane protein YedE/YeeE
MKKKPNLLTLVSSTSFGLYLIAMIVLLYAVIEDNEVMEFFCGITLIIAALAAIISLFIALFRRRWILVFVNVLSLVAMAVVCFFCCIMLAAGQYRPPHYGEATPDDQVESELVEEPADSLAGEYQDGEL